MSRDAPLLDLPSADAAAGPAPAIPSVLALLPVRRIVLFPGLVVTLTVDDPAARIAHRVILDPETARVFDQRLELRARFAIGHARQSRRLPCRRHIVVGKGQHAFGTAHDAPRRCQPGKSLRRGHLVKQVQVDIEKRLAVILGNEVRVIAPPTLTPPAIDRMHVTTFTDMDEGLKGADVVMMLRLQHERAAGRLIPSVREYYRFYGLDAEKLSVAKPDAIVMHPGPMNRGVEIDPTIADGPRSVINEQVEMGVAVRMAVLDALLADPSQVAA